MGTGPTLLTAGTPLHLQLEMLPFGVMRDAFEGKVESILIDAGQFTDAHTDGEDLRAGMTLRFGSDTFENGTGYSDFVHSVSLTNARQLITRQHIDNARSAKGRAHHDHTRVVGSYMADDGRVFAQGMALQGAQAVLRSRWGNNRHQLAFVGNIHGIEAEHFAGTANFLTNGNRGFVEFHTDAGTGSNFVEGAGEAAAGGIAEAADFAGGLEEATDESMQRCGIAVHLSFELQAFTLGKNGDAVVAEETADENYVVGTSLACGERDTIADAADARGINEQAVGTALLNDFGVAGDDLYAGISGGFLHGVHNPL